MSETYNDVNILIVCTGNIFRSAAAGHLLEQHLEDIGEDRFTVKTAGTEGDADKTMDPKTVEALQAYGVDPSNHESTKLTHDHVEWADTILVMADYHQETLQNQYDAYSHLYNEFDANEETSVLDVNEGTDRDLNREQRIQQTVDYIADTIPKLTENLQYRHFLFREFAVGDRDRHINGAPFNPLLENNEAMAFLSLDIPEALENHVLVIPRDRYRYIDNIPSSTKEDMFALADTVGSAFRANHAGYNIVVNNGGAAGQQIFHTHIHVIPREPDDEADIEHWDHTSVDAASHKKYRERLLNELKNNAS